MYNPFNQKPRAFFDNVRSWERLAVPPYRRDGVEPATRARILLANAVEVEAVRFGHHLHRAAPDNEFRRTLAMIRRVEQQQQKTIHWLIPPEETPLETAIGYECLTTCLAAALAPREPDPYVRECMEFALVEDADHLYRFARLYRLDRGGDAEKLIGPLLDITPGRQLFDQHRHPRDSVARPVDFARADIRTRLGVVLLAAAEQQAMEFYMNLGQYHPGTIGRDLYREIAMAEEDHVSLYGSLLDPALTPMENLMLREYAECYLYYSLFSDETDPVFKGLWELFLHYEASHLQLAATLAEKRGESPARARLPEEFPQPLHFEAAADVVRGVLARQADLTADGETHKPVGALPRDHEYFAYQRAVNAPPDSEPGRRVEEALGARSGEG